MRIDAWTEGWRCCSEALVPLANVSSPALRHLNAQNQSKKEKDTSMWYFAWILGLPLAAAFAVLNAMWYELMDDEAVRAANASPK